MPRLMMRLRLWWVTANNLEPRHNANPELHVEPLTLLESFKCIRYRLWDEANFRLIGFGELKKTARA
ncbi:MAG: hypothetical protein H6654_15595 [Ardenticatenaceae bacterium]|nr:hypothetical protein [Anaerolineales bacterium]MCB8939593.1 hypothetical protein [Ardenticatenaceae bacterium]MCB8974982.1 hypothetical protein [Ardenticatenaceae bacterium]